MAEARADGSDAPPDGGASVLARDHLGAGLASRAARGTALTLGGQWGRFTIQTVSTIVLARLLTPDDYGLVGMVLALSGLAHLVTRMGLSQATVQRRDVTPEQVNAVFWINLALGLLTGGAVAGSAPLIASFYGRPELVAVTIALASTFVLDGLTVQHEALLSRSMRFGRLSLVESLSLGAGAMMAIAAAAQGAGYWALVILHVGDRLTRMVLVWRMSGWRPTRPRRAPGVAPMLTFGANLGLFGLLNYLSRHLDNVLIGRVWGAGPLGLYAKAYQLLLLPIQQINLPVSRVALPTLSLLQDQPERYRQYYRTAIGAIAYVAMPLIVMMAVLSEEIVLILLGSQWVDAAPIFRVLAFAGIAQTVAHANGWIYVSTGHTGRQAVWGLVSRPLVVLSFIIGLPWGPYGVAVSYTVATLLLIPPAFLIAVRGTPLTIADILAAARRPVLVTAVVYAVAAQAHAALAGQRLVQTVVVTLAAGAVGYAVAVLLPRRTRHEAFDLVRLLRASLAPRRVARPSEAAT